MSDRFFPYALDTRWNRMFKLLGVGERDGVTIGDDGSLVATFGRQRVETTLDNVKRTSISGDHRWYTAVGLRLSFTDDGLTFGTNHHRGVCIEFHERIRKVVGFRDHSALWVSVADCEGLVAALSDSAA